MYIIHEVVSSAPMYSHIYDTGLHHAMYVTRYHANVLRPTAYSGACRNGAPYFLQDYGPGIESAHETSLEEYFAFRT